MRAHESTRLGQSLKKPNRHDGLWVVRSSSDHSQCSPDHHHGREEDPWFDVVESDVARNLSDDIAWSN